MKPLKLLRLTVRKVNLKPQVLRMVSPNKRERWAFSLEPGKAGEPGELLLIGRVIEGRETPRHKWAIIEEGFTAKVDIPTEVIQQALDLLIESLSQSL